MRSTAATTSRFRGIQATPLSTKTSQTPRMVLCHSQPCPAACHEAAESRLRALVVPTLCSRPVRLCVCLQRKSPRLQESRRFTSPVRSARRGWSCSQVAAVLPRNSLPLFGADNGRRLAFIDRRARRRRIMVAHDRATPYTRHAGAKVRSR